MGCKSKVLLALLILVLSWNTWNAVKDKPVPVVERTYWGPGEYHEDDTHIVPFKINVADEVLRDLKNRLADHRNTTKTLEGAVHHYGLNNELVGDIVGYWKNDYNWRKREAYMNTFSQFVTEIQGLKIHYIHVKPTVKNKRIIPLIFVHAWPGSVVEFLKIIPLMTEAREERDFVFEVIVPSLPGYGFSDGASKIGLGTVEIAVILNNLMERLGFDKYYAQGGDLGALIVPYLGIFYPERVLGIHGNMCYSLQIKSKVKVLLGSVFSSYFMSQEEASKAYYLSRNFIKNLLESGYILMQSTKPDMIGLALNDSPVGLAVYILEKFSGVTREPVKDLPDAGLKTKFTYDELLDNIMYYWITNSITTSMRLYAEMMSNRQFAYDMNSIPVKVPSACARFKNEVFHQSEWILKDMFLNLVHLKDFKTGGHFPALEVPGLLADDIFEAIHKMEALHKKI